MKKTETRVRHSLPVPEQKKPCICDCTDCHWANLVQYEGPREPLLAECTMKPQPYSPRFPYQVEVARAKKLCSYHQHTDVAKVPQVRAKVRRVAMACYVVSQPQQTA